MKQFTTYKIASEHGGLTIEAYLKQILQHSGRRLQKLTRQKGIRLNGKPAFLARKLAAGDTLQVLKSADSNYGVEPQPGPVDILYEDNCLLVLNKAAGQLIHPTGRTTDGTLANYLAHHFEQQQLVTTIRPVHRLDRDTSGCIIFAKDARSQTLLEQQLAKQQLKRTYQAIVHGIPSPPAATIDAPIDRHPTMPNRRIVIPQGQSAVTHYRLLQELPALQTAALLELELATGRTHQIRVHLAHIGNALLGDGMYGTRTHLIGRQALHAAAVRFFDLTTGAAVAVTAPLPPDMARLLSIKQ